MNGERASLDQAITWLDRLSFPIATTNVPPSRAVGRALLMELRAGHALPPNDRATLDGFALRAEDTEGAGPYNPQPVAAIPVASGDTMPPGTDAVLAADLLEHGCALEAAAVGEGVARAASQLKRGALIFPAGHRLRPQDVALLSELEVGTVVVRYGLAVHVDIDPRLDGLAQALLSRDLCETKPASQADVILTTRPTTADSWEIQGLALRPAGEAVCFGRRRKRLVLRLPRDWLGFTLTYELLAARLIRGHAGFGLLPEAPAVKLLGKIVSAIGLTDVVLVRLSEAGATPLPGVETGGAAALSRADGYVLVPATREGFAAGDLVTVHAFAA